MFFSSNHRQIMRIACHVRSNSATGGHSYFETQPWLPSYDTRSIRLSCMNLSLLRPWYRFAKRQGVVSFDFMKPKTCEIWWWTFSIEQAHQQQCCRGTCYRHIAERSYKSKSLSRRLETGAKYHNKISFGIKAPYSGDFENFHGVLSMVSHRDITKSVWHWIGDKGHLNQWWLSSLTGVHVSL